MTIYLNYLDLNIEAQEEVFAKATELCIQEEGEDNLRQEAKDKNINYHNLLTEKTERYLYQLDIKFNI